MPCRGVSDPVYGVSDECVLDEGRFCDVGFVELATASDDDNSE